MHSSLIPAALKPLIVGFAIGFVLVGIARMADAREAQPDKVIHLATPASKGMGNNWVALR